DPVKNDPRRHAELGDTHQFSDRLLGSLRGQREQHDEAAIRLLVKLPRPVIDGADDRDAQLRVLDGRYLLVGTVHELGVHPIAVHVLTAILGIGGTKDAGLRLLCQARPRVAVDWPPAHTSPADPAPWPSLDDPLPGPVRSFDYRWPVVTKLARQALGP